MGVRLLCTQHVDLTAYLLITGHFLPQIVVPFDGGYLLVGAGEQDAGDSAADAGEGGGVEAGP